MIFGPQDLLAPRVRGLRGGVELFGERIPVYDLYLIGLAPVVFGALWLVLHRTRWGTLVRAATHDREMVAGLGVNQGWLFTGAFALGAFLAGLGGALQLQREAVNLGMGIGVIAEAFVVVVIGGMGSIGGALVAAILIGLLHAVGAALFPQLTLVLTSRDGDHADAHAEVDRLALELQRAAEAGEEGAEREGAGEEPALVDAEPPRPLAVVRRRAHQRAPARAVKDEPERAEDHRRERDEIEVVDRDALAEELEGRRAGPARAARAGPAARRS